MRIYIKEIAEERAYYKQHTIKDCTGWGILNPTSCSALDYVYVLVKPQNIINASKFLNADV